LGLHGINVTKNAGELLPRRFTLTKFRLCGKFGGLLSVALFPKITLGVR